MLVKSENGADVPQKVKVCIGIEVIPGRLRKNTLWQRWTILQQQIIGVRQNLCYEGELTVLKFLEVFATKDQNFIRIDLSHTLSVKRFKIINSSGVRTSSWLDID